MRIFNQMLDDDMRLACSYNFCGLLNIDKTQIVVTLPRHDRGLNLKNIYIHIYDMRQKTKL